jgi:hypothetical protein
MTTLFPPPARYALPLSMGQDLVVDFQSVDSSENPVNYADGVTVTLTISTPSPVTATATVSTYHAVCYVAATTVNAIPNGVEWRCVAAVPGGLGTPGTVDVVLANGKTLRADGAND